MSAQVIPFKPDQVYIPTLEQWTRIQNRLDELEQRVANDDELLTVKDMTRIYKVSETTQWRKRRKDASFKFINDNGTIKYRRSDMDKYFNKKRSK